MPRRRRTVLLDVLDPELPPDVQLRLDARLRELKSFRAARPSLWTRFVSLWDRVPATTGGSAVLDACSVGADCIVFLDGC